MSEGILIPGEYKYGEMTLFCLPPYTNSPTGFAFSFGDRTLDFCNLPDDHPAKYKDGIKLSVGIYSPQVYKTSYDSSAHKLIFAEEQLEERTFPLRAFEELHEAALVDWLNNLFIILPAALENNLPLPSEILQLPSPVQKLLYASAKEIAKITEDKIYNSKDYSALLAMELVRKYMINIKTIKEIYEWCDNDVQKIGLTDAIIAERALLNNAIKARNEDELKYWSSDLLRFRPYSDIKDLHEKIKIRLWYLYHGKNMNSEQNGEGPFLPPENVKTFLQRYGITV